MQLITSFTVNHDVLEKGMYISRIDGDVVTYDIRMKKPNNEDNDYLSTGGMHTLEHIFATYARNSKYTDSILYVGPMGCRTGFYLLVRDTMSHEDSIRLVQDSMAYIADFTGPIPGAQKRECGNFADQNLEEAKAVAADMVRVLKDWTPADMTYKD